MRNIVLGRASTTSPSTSIFSSFWAITSSRGNRALSAVWNYWTRHSTALRREPENGSKARTPAGSAEATRHFLVDAAQVGTLTQPERAQR
jgi:hypothetical protein